MADNQIVNPDEAVITELPLPGEPATDKGYRTEGGLALRVRVVQTDAVAAPAVSTGEPVVASAVTLRISLAVLDDDLRVARDGAGALRIMDASELLISGEAYRNPAFDPAEAVERAIRQETARLETWNAKQQAVAAYLASAWGGAVPNANADG